MELKRAKEVLEGMTTDDLTSECIRLSALDGSIYIKVYYDGIDTLHGYLTTNQLEAIATWMRDPEGVVGA